MPATLRLLLDEHYPRWAADALQTRGIDAISIQYDWSWLQSASDDEVLAAAVADGRVVVTEDVSTFPAALAKVPHHCGVIYCRWNIFPRTRPGITALADALAALAENPPVGLGSQPVVWWLQPVRQGDGIPS